jgi:kynureninase
VNVAIDPKRWLVDIGACAFASDDQDPNRAVFMTASKLSQFHQVGPGVGKVLQQLSEFGVLVKAIELRVWQWGFAGYIESHEDVQKKR